MIVDITLETVLEILPFGNTFYALRVNGSTIRKMYEHSIRNYDPSDASGAFLQASGS